MDFRKILYHVLLYYYLIKCELLSYIFSLKNMKLLNYNKKKPRTINDSRIIWLMLMIKVVLTFIWKHTKNNLNYNNFII